MRARARALVGYALEAGLLELPAGNYVCVEQLQLRRIEIYRALETRRKKCWWIASTVARSIPCYDARCREVCRSTLVQRVHRYGFQPLQEFKQEVKGCGRLGAGAPKEYDGAIQGIYPRNLGSGSAVGTPPHNSSAREKETGVLGNCFPVSHVGALNCAKRERGTPDRGIFEFFDVQ